MTMQGKPGLEVWRIAVRPDSKQVATVHSGEFGSDFESEVILWDMSTGNQTHVLRGHGSGVYGCSYSNDGSQLATIGMNVEQPGSRGTLNIWDVETGKRLNQIKLDGVYSKILLDSYGFPVLPGVAFSHDDQFLVSWPRPVEVRDSNTQAVLWQCEGLHALHLDENRVLVYTGNMLEIREISSGKILDQCEKRFSSLSQIQLSADKKKLSCISVDKMLVWDSVDSLSDFIELSIPGIYWGALSPDGMQVIFSARKGELGFQNLDRSKSKSSRSLLGHQGMVTHGGFTQDGKWLVTAGVDGTAKTWPLNPKQRLANTLLMHDSISNICFSQDGEKVHYAARRADRKKRSYNVGTVNLYDFNFSTEKIKSTFCAHWPRGDFSFSPDGKFLAAPVSEPDRPDDVMGFAKMDEIGVWNCDSWEKQCSVKTGLADICSVQLRRNGEMMAVAGRDNDRKLIKFFDLHSDQNQVIGELEVEEPIVSMVLRKSKLAVATVNQVSIWSLKSNLKNPSDPCRLEFDKQMETSIDGEFVCLEFSPDGTRLGVADHKDDDLLMLDCETGETLYRRAGPRAFCCVQFSPCGKRLALSGYDSIGHLCDAESGYRLLTLVGSDASPGNFAINSRVVFSPDGKKIATNTWKGHIRLWNLEDKLAQ